MGENIFCDERRVYVKFGMRGQEAGSHLGADFLFCNFVGQRELYHHRATFPIR